MFRKVFSYFYDVNLLLYAIPPSTSPSASVRTKITQAPGLLRYTHDVGDAVLLEFDTRLEDREGRCAITPTRANEAALRFMRTHFQGKTLVDLGSGNLAYTQYLLRTKPKRVLACDSLYENEIALYATPKAASKIQLCPSVSASMRDGLLVHAHEDQVFFLGSPLNTQIHDISALLASAKGTAVVGMCNDGFFASGTLDMVLALLTRQVQPNHQSVGPRTSFATYLEPWCKTRDKFYDLQGRWEPVFDGSEKALVDLVDHMVLQRAWPRLTYIEYLWLATMTTNPLLHDYLGLTPQSRTYGSYADASKRYPWYLGRFASHLGEPLKKQIEAVNERIRLR